MKPDVQGEGFDPWKALGWLILGPVLLYCTLIIAFLLYGIGYALLDGVSG